MLIRKQDVSALCLYGLGYSTLRNLIYRIRKKPLTTIVCFHDLAPASVERFRLKMHFLKQSTNVVSLDDFFSGKLCIERLNVVITFDDGYQSWVSEAVPILKKLRFPATFFISSGFIGLSKERESDFIRSRLLLNLTPQSTIGGLSVQDVKILVREGFTIGGHTVNHCNLAEVLDNVQLRYELAEDKKRLESITGAKIEYFSYPFGYYQNPKIDLAEVLRETGYKGAVTTVSGFNTYGSCPYLLHREITTASMPGSVFRSRVYGNYHAVLWLKQKISIICTPQ